MDVPREPSGGCMVFNDLPQKSHHNKSTILYDERVHRDKWDEILELKHLTTYSMVYNPCLTFVQVKYLLVFPLVFKFLTVTPLTCLMINLG